MERQLRERLINLLLILLIIIAALYLAQMLWQLLSGFADLMLLFLLGWLVSFILNPIVYLLTNRVLPIFKIKLSRNAAVTIVYVGSALLAVIVAALLVPPLISQFTQIAGHLPQYMDQVPEASRWLQAQFARIGVRVNLQQAIDSGLSSLQNYATTIVQNALMILTSLLSLLANLFLVLIIGFIMTMDGPRLWQAILRHIPETFHDEFQVFSQNVDQSFGGFLRGQLIQALIIMVGTIVAMTVFGLNYVLVASLFAGLFMLIPLIGPFLALIPPLLAALLQNPDAALWIFLILFVYQFAIVNVLMPRVLSHALGLHPLLVFGAILVSIRVAGFWGAFFGIPVAGVLWTMATFFFERWQNGQNHTDESKQVMD